MLKFKVLNLLNINNFRVLVSFRGDTTTRHLVAIHLVWLHVSFPLVKYWAVMILNKRIDTFHGTSGASNLSFHPVLKSLMATPRNKLVICSTCKNTNKLDTTQGQY